MTRMSRPGLLPVQPMQDQRLSVPPDGEDMVQGIPLHAATLGSLAHTARVGSPGPLPQSPHRQQEESAKKRPRSATLPSHVGKLSPMALPVITDGLAPRPPIRVIRTVVDLLDPSKSEEVSGMIARSFVDAGNDSVYYICGVRSDELAGRARHQFVRELTQYFMLVNASTIRSGAACQEFRDPKGNAMGVCICSPPVDASSIPCTEHVLDEGEEDDADAYEREEFVDSLADLWGDGAVERLVDVNEPMESLMSEAFDDNKTLSIDMLCASPDRIGSGIGSEMLRQLLKDQEVTRGAENVMAVTFSSPEFWVKCGLPVLDRPFVISDFKREDGAVLKGFNVTVHKGRIADVLECLDRQGRC